MLRERDSPPALALLVHTLAASGPFSSRFTFLARCEGALLNAPVTPTPPRLPPSLDCSRHRDPSDGDKGSRTAKKKDVDVKLWVRWEKDEGKLTSLWSKELDDELVESSEDGDLVLALDAASLI